MSSISMRLDGDTEELLARLENLSTVDKRGAMQAIAEALRTGTMDRFDTQEEPSGKRWRVSVRANQESGKTLIKTTNLKNSIHAEADSKGAVVGTNDIRAATHQFGDSRTIRPKRKKVLRFQVDGKWVSARKVDVNIPARPFLGVSDEDMEEVKSILEELFEEG